jgi:hypothetical protein
MRKTGLQQRQIVMAVDRSTGIVDLSIFAAPLKGHRTPEVVRLLTERTSDRGSAARSRICRQKVKKVEGGEALGPRYMSRRSLPHALMPAGWVGCMHSAIDGFHAAAAHFLFVCSEWNN